MGDRFGKAVAGALAGAIIGMMGFIPGLLLTAGFEALGVNAAFNCRAWWLAIGGATVGTFFFR
jgi:hypothetical protein